MNHPDSQKNTGLLLIVAVLVLGFLTIAVIDESYRPAFADLAKVGIGGYLAMIIPIRR